MMISAAGLDVSTTPASRCFYVGDCNRVVFIASEKVVLGGEGRSEAGEWKERNVRAG